MAARRSPAEQREQLAAQRRKVDFDTYDITVDELLRRVGKRRIDIAPVYQRQFRWDQERQSRLVESVLLGIPIPPLFMATNAAVDVGLQWEVVDGLQRLLTLVHFAGDDAAREVAGIGADPLVLRKLDKLDMFEGSSFGSMPHDIQRTFEDRPLKIIVLNDKSELQVRYDLFERLNTGGIALTAQEIRECVYKGEFVDLLTRLAVDESFKSVVVLPEPRWKDGTPQDFVLRFFAFYDRYQEFEHSVGEFLKDFVDYAHREPRVDERAALFGATFEFLAECFPSGVRTRKGQTPVNLFEGLAVGAALALKKKPNLKPTVDPVWTSSPELKKFTTGATNSRPRVAGRIEYCRDAFLGKHA